MHSEYSVSDGMLRLDQAVKRALEDHQGALALTDLSNLFGLVKFYKEARARGLKPIVGCDLWISLEGFGGGQDKASRLLLLAQDRSGYLRLCELLSRAWLENQVRGRPEVRFEWFKEHGTGGLIALSGAQAGDVGMAIANDQLQVAVGLAQRWAALFPQRYYLELQRYGQNGAESYIAQALGLARELDLPVVATH